MSSERVMSTSELLIKCNSGRSDEQCPSSSQSDPRPGPKRSQTQPLPVVRQGNSAPEVSSKDDLWKDEWNDKTWENGRVLIVDLEVKDGRSIERHKEISNIEALNSFFEEHTRENVDADDDDDTVWTSSPQQSGDNKSTGNSSANDHEDGATPALNRDSPKDPLQLRLIHVQNAAWAKEFFLTKFDMLKNKEIGRTMSRTEIQPHRNGRNPVLRANAPSMHHEHSRKIKSVAFQSDCVRLVKLTELYELEKETKDDPWLSLDLYGNEERPKPMFGTRTESISVYVQSQSEETAPSESESRERDQFWDMMMFIRNTGDYKTFLELVGNLPSPCIENETTRFDNGNAIIIFSDTAEKDLRKTLIGARSKAESQWRFLRASEKHNSADFITHCMDIVLQGVFSSIVASWGAVTETCEMHVNMLEEKVYDDPSDMSIATELWKTSAAWMTMGRLMHTQKIVAKNMWTGFKAVALTKASEESCFLDDVAGTYDKVFENWEGNVVKRTEALSDMMYRTVAFQDSRDSFEFSVSMWRLSWITFIFLPLTFSVGVFGMNVDTFEANPSIWWWILASAIILLVVLCVWYIVKHTIASRNITPHRRKQYRKIYQELTGNHQKFRTANGPISIKPSKFNTVGAWKRQKLNTWFNASHIKSASPFKQPKSDLGIWSNTKFWLAKRWSSQPGATGSSLPR